MLLNMYGKCDKSHRSHFHRPLQYSYGKGHCFYGGFRLSPYAVEQSQYGEVSKIRLYIKDLKVKFVDIL